MLIDSPSRRWLAPVFDQAVFHFKVRENLSPTTILEHQVVAKAEPGNTLRYRIASFVNKEDWDLFDIGPVTGWFISPLL